VVLHVYKETLSSADMTSGVSTLSASSPGSETKLPLQRGSTVFDDTSRHYDIDNLETLVNKASLRHMDVNKAGGHL
jgi:hypothetical protein